MATPLNANLPNSGRQTNEFKQLYSDCAWEIMILCKSEKNTQTAHFFHSSMYGFSGDIILLFYSLVIPDAF